tara:strand:+ start:4212 stop:4952 length:741 start_codon:yes stop_codon:yes gene_type:complete
MIHQDKRRAFHKGMVAGKTPADIAQEHGVDEIDVVQTLRHPKPKIAGVNYNHLKVPVPMDEIIDAFYEDSLDTLGELYGVGAATLRLRLPKELRDKIKRGRKAKTKPKATEILTSDEKKDIVDRYYRSGRKLNACGVSTHIAKEVLKEQDIPFKKHGAGDKSIPSRDQITLLDCLIEKTAQGIIDPQVMFVWSRKLYEFKTNSPHVWKGQMLDWLLENKISQEIIPHINEAIEQVIKLRGYEDVDS